MQRSQLAILAGKDIAEDELREGKYQQDKYHDHQDRG
jgi:hypothetical protein